MGVLLSKRGPRGHPLQTRRRFDPEDPEAVRVWIPSTSGGVYVNHDIALTYTAFWAAVRVISETIAQLPWNVYRRTDKGTEKLPDHILDRLLNVQANPETDAFTFRTVMLGWALTWGNGYAEIQRDGYGRPAGLWQIPPDRVDLVRDEDGRLLYEVRNNSRDPDYLLPKDVLHVKGLGWDGQRGYSVVGYHVKTIGAALGQNEYSANFLDGMAIPAGVLSNKRQMSPEAKKKWIEAFRKAHQGAGKRRSLLIVDEGMDYQSVGVPPETAQVFESKKFSVLDICRIFGVAPHLLGELEFATFSNIEEQNRQSATAWIVPWSRRMEAPINTKLLQGTYYCRHNYNALIRADIEKRYNAYNTGVRGGWMSPNEVRELEDMNSIGPDGDVYVMQSQMVQLEDIANPPEPQPVPAALQGEQGGQNVDESQQDAGNGPQPLTDNQRQAFVDLLGDVFRRASNRVHHRVKQGAGADSILGDHYKYLCRELTGPAESIYGAMAEDVDKDVVDVLTRMAANAYYEQSRDELTVSIDPAGLTETWGATRAQAAAASLFNDLRNMSHVR